MDHETKRDLEQAKEAAKQSKESLQELLDAGLLEEFINYTVREEYESGLAHGFVTGILVTVGIGLLVLLLT